ncbi:uncharacterized protein Fot_02681 [Forsythia ovata]|uniref:Uncharacterized protein n=1 Tax=Forsythia ovata TaxID=205694 RepID=A0ABD1X810_9LAMI
MEEYVKQVVLRDCPRKLDFDAPLLSTRRPFGIVPNNDMLPTNPDKTSQDTQNGVPFSWERIPGEPKDMETSETSSIDVPPPKLPPGRWQPPQEATSYDDGCDGDVDDDDYNKKDCFSDVNAIDIFSLAESIEDDKDKADDKFIMSMGTNSTVDEPNFIIQRFLPDAQALAAASVVHNKVHISSTYPSYPCVSRAVSVRRAYPSPKGCGLGTLFRWGLKPKPCSVKIPVQGKSLRVLNSQWRTKPKQNGI